MEQAKESAVHWRNGTPRGQLEGIPVAIKDVLPVKGWPTKHGSPACADATPEIEDAVAVERLREHGAIFIGKTRTWEFAWHGRIDRPKEEVVANPWNPAFSCAGSSSGSAAAVADGLCVLALGTDSGGSVRGPASYCGIVGIKPTQARVPVYPPSPMMDMEHIGVLARNAADAALMLSVIAGYHPSDPDSWPFPTIDLGKDIGTGIAGLQVGVSVDLGFAAPHPEIASAFSHFVERLTELQVRPKPLELTLDESIETTTTIYTPMAMASLDRIPASRTPITDPIVRNLSEASETLSSKTYFRALQKRQEVRRQFSHAFRHVDLIMTPTMETLPNRLEEPSPDMMINRVFDMTGQPAVSIPIGFSASGLPIGIQIVAPKGRDALVLRAAHALEQLFPPIHPRSPTKPT